MVPKIPKTGFHLAPFSYDRPLEVQEKVFRFDSLKGCSLKSKTPREEEDFDDDDDDDRDGVAMSTGLERNVLGDEFSWVSNCKKDVGLLGASS